MILHGEAVVRIGDVVTRFGPGEFFGEISLLTGDPPVADVVALTMLRCLVSGARLRALPAREPSGAVPDAAGGGAPAPDRHRVEERLLSPFPPGDYDAVVVGTGPAGLRRATPFPAPVANHALLSADEAPGGMFGGSRSSSG